MGRLFWEVLGPGGAGWVLTQIFIIGMGTAVLYFLLNAFPGTKKYAYYIQYAAVLLCVVTVIGVVIDLFKAVGQLLGV